MKYGFIRKHAQRWPVVHQRRLLGVQRSAYYDWRDQPCKVIPPEELALRRAHDGSGIRLPVSSIRPMVGLSVPLGAAMYMQSINYVPENQGRPDLLLT